MPDFPFPTGRDGSDDRAGRALRRALAAQASAVEPGPAPRVGELVDRRRPRRWPAALGVAASVALLAVTSAVALQRDATPAPVAGPSATASPSTATTTGPTSGPGPSTTAAAPSTVPAPTSSPERPATTAASPSTDEPSCPYTDAPVLLWSVVDQATTEGRALRLVPDRARVQIPCLADASDPEVLVRGAVAALLSREAPDADHTNLWWSGVVRGQEVPVAISGSGTTLDLPSAVFEGGVGSEAASVAVSALVRTVVSNGGTAPVTLLVDGQAGAEVWGSVVLDGALSPSTQDLAGGWILDPYEDQQVPAGTVTLSGTATAFEATVNWEVLGEGGVVVAEGFTMAGSNGEYGPWTAPVELSPGAYTAVLWADNMAGSDEGPGPRLWEETKTFTVAP